MLLLFIIHGLRFLQRLINDILVGLVLSASGTWILKHRKVNRKYSYNMGNVINLSSITLVD